MRVSALLFLFLASCNGPDWDSAHKRYLIMLTNHAPKEDMCAFSRRNAQIALNAMDEGEYKSWVAFEKEDCQPPATAS
jgi:hypothetical protein